MNRVRLSSLLSAVVLASGCLTADLATAAPTLLNGSFEDPAVTTTTRGGGTNWTSSGAVDIFPNTVGAGVTPYGKQFLAVLGRSSDSQTVADFEAGGVYVLGFDYAEFTSGGGNPMLTVTLSGVFSYTQSFTLPTTAYSGTDTIPFISGVIVFVAPVSGSETFTFADPGSTLLVLDNVGLYGNVTSAVPEPTSVAATLLGAGVLVGVFARRRAARRA